MENGPTETITKKEDKQSPGKNYDQPAENECVSGKNWQKSGVPLKAEVHINSSYSSNTGGHHDN